MMDTMRDFVIASVTGMILGLYYYVVKVRYIPRLKKKLKKKKEAK